MTTVDQFDILEEVVVKLRNGDIYTIAERGVTTVTEDFDGDGADKTFVVSHSNVKNVRSVLIGVVAQVLGTDYTMDYSTATVTFTNAPAIGVDNIHVTYDYGTDIIHPGYPRSDLSLASFPRIGVEFINIVSTDGGFGNVNLNTYNISIVVYDFKKETVRNKIKSIRTLLINNMQGFLYIKIVKPNLIGPLALSGSFDKFRDKIYQQNIDFNGRFNLEIN